MIVGGFVDLEHLVDADQALAGPHVPHLAGSPARTVTPDDDRIDADAPAQRLDLPGGEAEPAGDRRVRRGRVLTPLVVRAVRVDNAIKVHASSWPRCYARAAVGCWLMAAGDPSRIRSIRRSGSAAPQSS